MTILPNQLSVAEFALRVIARPSRGSVFVLVCPGDLVERVLLRLMSELQIQGDTPTQHVSEPHNAGELIFAISSARTQSLLIVSGLETFDDENWQRLDLLRSRLLRDGAMMFLMSQAAVGRLSENAPNLASWIGGSIWNVDLLSELLSEEEREARLQTLREWAGRTDDDVQELAASGLLSKEPEYVEWLILLKRPDLIGNA